MVLVILFVVLVVLEVVLVVLEVILVFLGVVLVALVKLGTHELGVNQGSVDKGALYGARNGAEQFNIPKRSTVLGLLLLWGEWQVSPSPDGRAVSYTHLTLPTKA